MVLARTALSLIVFCSAFAFAQDNTDAAIERRIDALLQQMTIQEKAGQLTQYDSASPARMDLVKKGEVGSLFNLLGAEQTNAVQRVAVEQSRLKIPILFGYDVIHGYRTVFPVPLASAGSFDPDLIEQSERVAAKEASAAGLKWVFAPMLDISRDPRWGRIVEGIGEDPYLGSVVATARVRGFQGTSLSDPQSVLASMKHYVGYGGAEGGRDYNGAEISDRTLRQIYLPPFHAAVKAGGATVMSAFDDLNGVPASANHYTLTEILRGEWGFTGFVVSDYNSVQELINHGIAADDAGATSAAINAGVDMAMADGTYARTLPELVQSGKVSMSVLDEAVRRVLRAKFRAGLFENPYTDPKRAATEILSAENRAVARKMAQESIVLLKNDKGMLPLSKAAKTIALIGPLADDQGNQLGSWAGHGQAVDTITPLAAIKAKLPGVKLVVSRGTDLDSRGQQIGAGNVAPVGSTGVAGTSKGKTSIADAVSAAKQADVAVLFLGEPAQYTGEASSRASLDLPGDQQKLLEAVAATSKPIVLVLESGRPLDIRWANEHVPAILQAWYPGTEGGNAIADLLFGDASPSARLPVSWPQFLGQIPVYYNHKNTGRPTSPDRWHTGYQYESKDPLFPFGYGLTYTTFKYSNLKVETPNIAPSGVLRVTAEVANTGKVAGTEVVQLYIHGRVAPTTRAVRELKAFSRVTLAPGEHKTVEFSVNANDLGCYDLAMKWVVPDGTYDVWVAPNAVEGEKGEFQVTAQ